YTFTSSDFIAGTLTIKAKATTGDEETQITVNSEVIDEGDATPEFGVSYGSTLTGHPVLTNSDFTFDGADTIPTAVGTYVINLNQAGKQKVRDANSNYSLSDTDFISGNFIIQSVSKDPDGGVTRTQVDGSGAITQITKDWPDGDKTVVDISTDTNTARVTETPKGEPNLPSVT
ncbi:MBG domain-containing protein, partial [Secundilactobacillus odoratitofui]|uniref:MBG domain-containing protein n=1 Tax=Secundilactobacillus odoratitofui TaxID=480930 RepID=UPI00138F3178